MFRTLALFLALASLGLAHEPVHAPNRLLLRIEGFDGPSYWLELVPGSSYIRYRSNPEAFINSEGTSEEKIEITNERWSVFWSRLEEAEIWKWKERYVPQMNPPDGTVWTVRLEWNGRKISSSGSNAYPEAKQFALFKMAVSELIGGRKFE